MQVESNKNIIKRYNNLADVLNKSSIKVCKPNKSLHMGQVSQNLLANNSFNLLRIYLNTMSADNNPQKSSFFYKELAFLSLTNGLAFLWVIQMKHTCFLCLVQEQL